MRCPECRVRLVPEGEAKCEQCQSKPPVRPDVRDGIALAREALEKAKKP